MVAAALETLVFQSVTLNSVEAGAERMQAFVTLLLDIVQEGKPTALKAKVDTGAQANILPLRLSRKMYDSQIDDCGYARGGALNPSKMKPVSYTGTPIPQHGIHNVKFVNHKKEQMADFYVTDAPGPASSN